MVKEREGGVGFGEAVDGVLVGVGDVVEETVDVTGLEVAGMAFVVEQDQGAGPVDMAFRGPILAEPVAGELTDEVKEARRLGGGLGWGRRSGHGSPPRSDGVDFG